MALALRHCTLRFLAGSRPTTFTNRAKVGVPFLVGLEPVRKTDRKEQAVQGPTVVLGHTTEDQRLDHAKKLEASLYPHL